MSDQYIPLLSFTGTLAVVVVGFLYNNSRLTDFAGRFTDLNARFTDLNNRFADSFSDLKDLIQAEAARSDANIARVESVLLTKFAELDNRLSRIESHLHLQ